MFFETLQILLPVALTVAIGFFRVRRGQPHDQRRLTAPVRDVPILLALLP